jgi:cytochrome c2
MKPSTLLAATALLTLLLSACGPPAEADPEHGLTTDDAAAPAAAAGAEVVATPAVPGEVTPTPGATPTGTPTPAASATPTAAASARPAAAPAVAMAPPAAFATCGVCHSVTPGQNMIGPSLAGVVGRRSGTVPGFSYSAGAKDTHITWNDGTLDRYLADPSAVIPGTTMPAPGVDVAQRRAIIAYLKSL